MIRQIAVAVLSVGALAACVPYTDGMTPYGYSNPLAQAVAAMAQPTTPYGYGQATPYGYGQATPYGYGAAAPMYPMAQPMVMPQPQPQVVYMPQQASAPYYAPQSYGGYGYGAGRTMGSGVRHVAADRDGNGVPDWRERDRNNDGVPDYQQRTRRTR